MPGLSRASLVRLAWGGPRLSWAVSITHRALSVLAVRTVSMLSEPCVIGNSGSKGTL